MSLRDLSLFFGDWRDRRKFPFLWRERKASLRLRFFFFLRHPLVVATYGVAIFKIF